MGWAEVTRTRLQEPLVGHVQHRDGAVCGARDDDWLADAGRQADDLRPAAAVEGGQHGLDELRRIAPPKREPEQSSK